jgi:hypothetical protein
VAESSANHSFRSRDAEHLDVLLLVHPAALHPSYRPSIAALIFSAANDLSVT